MPALKKATLQEISNGENPQPIGDAVDVQFNPESLRIQLSNRVEGGRSQGRQVRQYVGSSSNVFTLDLEFDTADEGSTDEPVSVLEHTAIVEKYVQPKTEGIDAKQQPPLLRFQWGNLIIDGVVESIDLDFDHFAHNGYPLHAKASLRMKEQKIEYQLNPRSGGGAGDRAARALGGELAVEMAVRLGLDAGAWRGLRADLSLGLELQAGLEVEFSAGLSASAGLGFKSSVEAGIDVPLEASVGLEAGAQVSGTAHLKNSAAVNTGAASQAMSSRDVSSQVALARAGGVNAAISTVKTSRASAASTAALSAFPGSTGAAAGEVYSAGGITAGPATDGSAAATGASAMTAGGRARTGEPSGKPTGVSPTLKARAAPDPRASEFGYGVPLKPLRTPAILDSRDYASNPRGRGARGSSAEPFSAAITAAAGPTSPPWIRLPGKDLGRKQADRVQTKRRPAKRCGCLGSCRH